MNYNDEMMNDESYINDDSQECPCDDEILDILMDTCVDLEEGDEYELDNDDFKRVFKANSDEFNTYEYYIIYDVQGDNVALLKFKK